MTLLTPARALRIISRLKLKFEKVYDTRANRGKKGKPLSSMLRLLVAGFACGKLVLRQIESLSEDMNKQILRKMGIRGRISDTALYERLERTPPDGFRETLFTMLRQDIDSKAIRNDLFSGGVISYDGKGAGSGFGQAPNEFCRSSVCDDQGTEFWDVFTMRACLTSSSAHPIIDQEIIDGKKGEATTFPDMLERDVKKFPRLFRYVTGDAGLPSYSNAQKVLDLNKVYLFQLKANFPKLYPLALSLLENQRVVAQTTEQYRGAQIRRELRRVTAPHEVSYPGATQFLAVKHIYTTEDGKVETEDRIYITAIPWTELSPNKLLQLIRLHWGIENCANWTTDMIFDEDMRKPCNQGHGPIVISWLNVLAYNIVAVFRTHLPLKDRLPVSWLRTLEIIYQACLGFAEIRRVVPILNV